MINCEFLEPVDIDPRALFEEWAFSKIDCTGSLDFSSSTLPTYLEKIESGEESFFYLDNRITSGDFLIVAFLIIFLISFSLTFIRDFAKNRKLERL